MKTDWKIEYLILSPFRRTTGFILLLIERIAQLVTSTGTSSNVLFTRIENDSKFFLVIASSKAS